MGGANRKRLVKRFLAYICPAFIISYALSLYGYIILGCRDINMIDTLTGGYWYLKALAIFVCLQAILIKCKRVYDEELCEDITENLILKYASIYPGEKYLMFPLERIMLVLETFFDNK